MKIALCTHSDSALYQSLDAISQAPEQAALLRISLNTAATGPDQLFFLPRSFCETQPYFKQLIPYVVIVRTGADGSKELLTYVRGGGGAEDRLHAKLSVGFGGHMDEVPALADCSSLLAVVDREARRELLEEVGCFGEYDLIPHSVLLEFGTDVDRVHLGVVLTVDADQAQFLDDAVTSQEVGTVDCLTWVPLAQLSGADRLETWSQVVVKRMQAEVA